MSNMNMNMNNNNNTWSPRKWNRVYAAVLVTVVLYVTVVCGNLNAPQFTTHSITLPYGASKLLTVCGDPKGHQGR